MPEQMVLSEEQLLATLIPEGIVCVKSALFHYGYSDFVPRKWSIAVPRTVSRAKLDVNGLPMQAYYMQPKLYELGKTTDDFDGVELSIYDRERTICDCFKYRSRLVNTYSIETTIAEKLDAILSLMEFSSRMKDYYDIYYLANKFDFDL